MSQDIPTTRRAPDLPAPDTPGPGHSFGRIVLGILRFPGNLVASQLEAKTGESQFGLGEDRMIMRTLIDTVVWSVIFVCIAWIIYA